MMPFVGQRVRMQCEHGIQRGKVRGVRTRHPGPFGTLVFLQLDRVRHPLGFPCFVLYLEAFERALVREAA